MERPKDIEPHKHNLPIPAQLIMLFHLVGLVGLSIPQLRPVFLQIVPFHLLLMLALLGMEHQRFDKKFVLLFLLIFIAGFTVEWIGVNKGWLFGNYKYGQTLGLKISSVPAIIGVNWFLLIYCVGTALQLADVRSRGLRILTGAIVLVVLDVLIEPVAGRFDYWHWAGNMVPAKNYVCWFFISAAMLFAFEKFDFRKQSIAGAVLMACQFIFFAALQQ